MVPQVGVVFRRCFWRGSRRGAEGAGAGPARGGRRWALGHREQPEAPGPHCEGTSTNAARDPETS